MSKFNIGLCSVSFRENSPKEIICAAKDAGIDCIEWGSDVHAPCNKPDVLSEIVSLQKEYGISCSSYGTYFYIMRDSADDLKQYIKAAKMLGTNILRLWCGEKGSAKYLNAEKDEFIAECKKLAEIARNEDVTLCMECHAGTFTDTVESVVELMQKVDSPNFKMYWQPYINISDAENITAAEKISPYSVNLHVFYWVDKKPKNLSQGKTVWQNYLKYFDSNRALLLEFMPDGKIETLKTEAVTLKEIAYN